MKTVLAVLDGKWVKPWGLERWFSSEEHQLLTQRTGVQIPAPTWQLTTTVIPLSGDLTPSLLVCGGRTSIKKKKKKKKKVEPLWQFLRWSYNSILLLGMDLTEFIPHITCLSS
jgi:hypothetical protein